MFAIALNATSVGHSVVRVITEPRVFLPAIVIAWFLTRRLRFTWKRRSRERLVVNWPTITATIEVPAVIQQYVPEKAIIVSLTYFYRNPDLQMGEYKREFGVKGQAKAWAEQFKGRTVLVHVNPKDPSDSVLLECDLAGNDLVTNLAANAPTQDWQALAPA